MKVHKVKTIGIALVFVALGLAITAGMERRGESPAVSATPARVDPTVTAPAERLGAAFEAIAARVGPAVVSVYAEKTIRYPVPESAASNDDLSQRFRGGESSPLPGSRRQLRVRVRGLGSGMLVDDAAHVLTNYHVVAGVSTIKVTLSDGRTLDAKVVGADPMTDVAVLQLTGAVPRDLPTVVLGDSDAVAVGDLVLAIGTPFALTQTVTNGIISATGRSDVGIAAYEDFLQTDAPINPGNSGGPLVNMRGEVIGMNSAIASGVGQSAGVSFAIPSNMIESMLPELSAGRRIVRGTLGIAIQDVTTELAPAFGLPKPAGVLVTQIPADSPAARAGVERGDAIVSYAGAPVSDGRALRKQVAATAPGTKIALGIVRRGERMMIAAIVGREPEPAHEAPPPAETEPDDVAFTTMTLTPALASQLDLAATRGALVTDVGEHGPAASAGLEVGDVIVEADRSPVATVEELARVVAVTKAKGARNLLLLVQRERASFYVVLRW